MPNALVTRSKFHWRTLLQFLPDVLRREHVVHQPLRPTGTSTGSTARQPPSRSPQSSPSRYGTVSSSSSEVERIRGNDSELFNDL